jgi:hypothetical protein
MGATAALSLRPSPRSAPMLRHPEPREGITGDGILSRETLSAFPESTFEIYDMVREISNVADGIGCACGCAALAGYQALLTCDHDDGMATECHICQGEARLAYRRAIDGRYG